MRKMKLLLLAMAAASSLLTACTASRHSSGANRPIPRAEKPVDPVIIQEQLPCPESEVRIDTATTYGKLALSIYQGQLDVAFDCDLCLAELDSMFREYEDLNCQFNDLLNLKSTPKIVYRNKYVNSGNTISDSGNKKSNNVKEDNDNKNVGNQDNDTKNKGSGNTDSGNKSKQKSGSPWPWILVGFMARSLLPTIIKGARSLIAKMPGV